MLRAPTLKPLSRMQEVICNLLGLGLGNAEIAGHLEISVDMVRQHIKRATHKIPGDLPGHARCAAWARGATLDVLQGDTLRREMLSRPARRPWKTIPPLCGEIVESGHTS